LFGPGKSRGSVERKKKQYKNFSHSRVFGANAKKIMDS
jgi:hypothetical protein